MKRKRNVLAMLGWYDDRILMGIARYAREADWHLPSRHLYDMSVPNGWKGDGLLITHGSSPALWAFIRRQSRRQPTVLIGRNSPGLQVPQVYEDNPAIGKLAARHFLDRGFRNFAWFSPIAGDVAVDRREGFRQALVQANLDCALLEPSGPASGKPPDQPRERRWLAARLKELPKPLALFVVDDQIAADVIEVCLDSQLPVPQSVAVLGVGNLEIACECSHVPISSVQIDFEEIGYRAAEMLDRLMTDGSEAARPLVLPPMGVVARRSTDLQAAMHPQLLKAVQFMKDNFHLPLRVGDVADAAMISPRMLSQLFASELQQSPASQLLQVRLERVKALLRQTNQKFRQIAESCGLESERNLRRAFHREVGMSPQEFRQRHRVIPEMSGEIPKMS